MRKKATTILKGMAIGGLMFYLTFHGTSTAWAATTWIGVNSDWGTTSNWSTAALPGSTEDVLFRDVTAVNSVDVNGAPRVAGVMTFNANAANFQITGLDSANTLTIDGPNSLTTPDLIVSAGTSVTIIGAGAGGTNGTTGDFRIVGLSTTENFVFDIGAGASLNMQATMAGTSSSSGTRRGGVVKAGTGTLTFSAPQNIDVRPDTTKFGGIFVDQGTLQFAVDGARGNSAAPVSVASGATLEFKGTGYFGVGSASPASGNRGILTLSGNGVGGKGALYNSVGNNVLASGVNSSANAFGLGFSGGLLLLATDTSIGVEAGTTLTLSHGISNSTALSTAGVLSGTAGKLTKVGSGTLIFDANNNTSRAGYAQEIIVNQGTFLVNSPTTTTSIGGDRTSLTQFDLLDTSGLYVGQPVSVTSGASGLPVGTVIAGVGPTSIRFSEEFTGGTTGDTLTISVGAITSALNTSPVTVNNGGTFGGTGSILGSTVTVNDGGILAPGASAGTFTIGGLVLNNGALGSFELENTLGSHAAGGGASDYLDIVGLLDLSNITTTVGIDVEAVGGGDLAAAGSWILMSFDSVNPGTFDIGNIVVTGVGTGYAYDLSIDPTGASTGDIVLSLSVVPEPGCFMMAGIGLVALGAVRRRRRK